MLMWQERQVCSHVVVSLVLEPRPSLWWMSVAGWLQMAQKGDSFRNMRLNLVYSLFLADCLELILLSPKLFFFFGKK
jgi:hypothetical protein